MEAATLHKIVPSAPLSRCEQLIDGYNWCCTVIDANTVKRCAMLLAQVCEESASLRATEEYASGAEYNGRLDLGNTHSGDGERFKGRTLIQITGRNNYGRTSRWAHARGLVSTSTYFVDHPTELAKLKFAWVGPAQYWLADHNHGYDSINKAADHSDLSAATYMVNGAHNGYDVREMYYHRALNLGSKILPTKPEPEVQYSEAMLFTVSKSECKRLGTSWPGWWLTDGFNARHVKTTDELHALGKIVLSRAIKFADFREIVHA